MLFSKDEVATFINNRFEAVWESVRPVPIVRVDFGNGNVITRTLHGNIATYVCTADGEVVDILPGIYTPNTYVEQLTRLRLLAQYAPMLAPEKRAEYLHKYHTTPLKSVSAPSAKVEVAAAQPPNAQPPNRRPNGPPGANPVGIRLDVGKSVRIEPRVLAVVARGAAPTKDEGVPTNPQDLAAWKVLREDTAANETVRRGQIHAILAKSGAVHPSTLTRQIYKDVLHADLDDPYLGLGPALVGTDPFVGEN